jgi:hypothetical protein
VFGIRDEANMQADSYTEVAEHENGSPVYKIDRNDLGFYLTFGGDMTKVELERWYKESEQFLMGQHSSFGVIIDMRTLSPLPAEAQEVMVRGQSMYLSRGMQRSCVILQDAITTIQFMRLARQSGIFKYERYIDASAHKDWLQEARNWVGHAIAPLPVGRDFA